MKRIVNGVTYNTGTSRKLARSTWINREDEEVTADLYQTRGGAFFVLHTWMQAIWNERDQEGQERERNDLQPMSADQAQKWMLEGDVEVFDNPFEDPPEAAAEAEPGSTIYVRVPPSLKRAIDQAPIQLSSRQMRGR
jgi:hypothetical protein